MYKHSTIIGQIKPKSTTVNVNATKVKSQQISVAMIVTSHLGGLRVSKLENLTQKLRI